MTILKCEYCNYTTYLKSNFNRHLNSLKHIKKHTSKKEHITEYFCKYCRKQFMHSQSMYRHIKYSCSKNKDEDLKELIRLMNCQTQEKNKELDFHKKQNEKQQRQINKLTNKLKINNIIPHKELLSYNDTDLSHLTYKDYERSIQKVNSCVKEMIEKIHFNPEKPENMNIYISNMKDKYIMVYEDGNWNVKYKHNVLNTLYDLKEMILEDFIEKYNNIELKHKFQRYINNKSHEETLCRIKDDIKLMMYNKKKKFE